MKIVGSFGDSVDALCWVQQDRVRRLIPLAAMNWAHLGVPLMKVSRSSERELQNSPAARQLARLQHGLWPLLYGLPRPRLQPCNFAPHGLQDFHLGGDLSQGVLQNFYLTRFYNPLPLIVWASTEENVYKADPKRALLPRSPPPSTPTPPIAKGAGCLPT